MPDSVQELLMLYKNGIIDGEALNTALKTLNNAPPQEPQPQEKNLTDKVREKRRRKKKARKQRKAAEKAAIAEKRIKCHK